MTCLVDLFESPLNQFEEISLSFFKKKKKCCKKIDTYVINVKSLKPLGVGPKKKHHRI